MDFKPENGFEQIKVSDKLDDVVEKAINKAIKDKQKKLIRKSKINKISIAVASIFILFITSIKFMPVFAQVLSSVTMGPSITRELHYHYDKNIGTIVKEGLAQNINESKTDKNIKVTINSVVADDKNLFVFYTLNGKENKEELKNLLLQNFKIVDDKGNDLLDSTFNYYTELPAMLYNRDGDFLLTFNKKYRCIVTSLGNNIKNYGQNEETYGALEISSRDGSKIPEKLNLKFMSFTEAYKMSYSKEKYNNFLSKFNREPISIKGDWSFNLEIDPKLVGKETQVYSNIKFSANHTDFNIKSFKIYPTRIETKIQLGKNKLDSSQCYSIGRTFTKKRKPNDSKLPYLIDEKGNKYVISDNDFKEMDDDKCINLDFQSCYFNNSKELYLVISELNYNNGSENFAEDIGEVKIRIK